MPEKKRKSKPRGLYKERKDRIEKIEAAAKRTGFIRISVGKLDYLQGKSTFIQSGDSSRGGFHLNRDVRSIQKDLKLMSEMGILKKESILDSSGKRKVNWKYIPKAKRKSTKK